MMPRWLPKHSLGARVLSQMAVRIAIVIVVVTVTAYWHVYRSVTASGVGTLAEYVRERGERESQLFLLAEDNMRVLVKNFFAERARAPQQAVEQGFSQVFARNADGATRRIPGFDVHREPAAYVASRVQVDGRIKRDIVTMTDLVRHFGRAWSDRYLTTFLASMEGLAATYWPGVDWYHDLEPNAEFSQYPWVQNVLPANDPQRRPAWTGVWYDWIGKQFATTCILPVDVDGQFHYYAGTSISLDDIIHRSRDTGLEGTRNMIFRADGQLVSHPDEAVMDSLRQQKGIYSIPASGDAHLRAIYAAVVRTAPGAHVAALDDYDEYLGVARIEGPDWYFVSVLPKQQLSRAANSTARTVLWLGLASLLLDLAIVGWIIRRQVSKPLGQAMERLDAFGHGDWRARIQVERSDELGHLGHAFNRMAEALDEHQRQARNYATLLESEVAQRTQQLEDRNRAKTRFLAAASHDLRQPIQAAALFVDHLKRASLPASAQQALHGLDLSLQSVGGLLEGLLDISKLDAGAVRPQMTVFPVKRVLDCMSAEFASLAQAKGLHWRVHSPDADWWVRSDPQLVSTVMRNLVANAVAYTQRGGVLLAVRRRGDQVALQVWD
ncbi:MAG: HAMP domain-containing protein, partial [Paucibacter sp.]|nr:HAMP domain-containing protein [Roseateles sp.]